ncbi:hypothetical protein G6F22_019539 [Rhizopus arrhizus]|nr:hypothetical protein G6F22_019539 [Rhizopus arrhizus]
MSTWPPRMASAPRISAGRLSNPMALNTGSSLILTSMAGCCQPALRRPGRGARGGIVEYGLRSAGIDHGNGSDVRSAEGEGDESEIAQALGAVRQCIGLAAVIVEVEGAGSRQRQLTSNEVPTGVPACGQVIADQAVDGDR